MSDKMKERVKKWLEQLDEEERCQVEEVTLDELVTYLIMRGLR